MEDDKLLNQNNHFNQVQPSADDAKHHGNADSLTSDAFINPEHICSLNSLTEEDYERLFDFLEKDKGLKQTTIITPKEKESLSTLNQNTHVDVVSKIREKARAVAQGFSLSNICFKSSIGNPIVFSRTAVKRTHNLNNSMFQATNFCLEAILKTAADIAIKKAKAAASSNQPSLNQQQRNNMMIKIKPWMLSESAKNKDNLSLSWLTLTADKNDPLKLNFTYAHALINPRKINERGYRYCAFEQAKQDRALVLKDIILLTQSCLSNKNIDFVMSDILIASLCRIHAIKQYNFSDSLIAELPILRTIAESEKKQTRLKNLF